MWDVETGQQMLILNDHSQEVYGVAFSPDGHTIATTSQNGGIRLWQADTSATGDGR